MKEIEEALILLRERKQRQAPNFDFLQKVDDEKAAMKKIEDRSWEIKKQLAERVKHQLRRIPVLHYYLDETLDHVFRMEELFKQINAEKKQDDNKE